MNFCQSVSKIFACLRWLVAALLAVAMSFTFAPVRPALAACDSNAAVTRVSVASDGTEANDESGTGRSHTLSASGDGRYVAFSSYANNLVSNDTNNNADVFVYDRQTCQITRVSVTSTGVQGNGGSLEVTISADGRYVAFESSASNLVAGDSGFSSDIFVHDRITGQTALVSLSSTGQKANSDSSEPTISADGRYIAFASYASNLVTGDTNSKNDIFVHDRATGQTIRVSVDSAGNQGNDHSNRGAISGNGRFVAFVSIATNLVANDITNIYDYFAHDTQTGETIRVSVDSAGNAVSNHAGDLIVISGDGRYVAFESSSNQLVTGDTNAKIDIFLRDLHTGELRRISVDSNGTQSNDTSRSPSISSDGRYVGFISFATNLVPNDTNTCGFQTVPGQCPDYFVYDRVTQQTIRLSESASDDQANGATNYLIGSVSADGMYAAFHSNASNLVTDDTNFFCDTNFDDIYIDNCQDAFVAKVVFPDSPPPAMLVVNSANDVDDTQCNASHCSLREAINAANELPNIHLIAFNILGGGVQTIQPAFSLPVITSPVIIDGTTQPGYAVGAPVIELDGSVAGSEGIGLLLAGGNSTVRGLVINRFKLNGVVIKNNGGSIIVGNFIGTDATGTLPRPNGQYVSVPNPIVSNGIYVDITAPDNIIGGMTVSERNVISGNNFQAGIMLMSSGNIVRGNFIGTNAAGTAALGNGFGVAVVRTNNNTIGGTGAGAGNIISGNQIAAMEINGSGNTIQGNYIGTDITGTLNLGNAFVGISIAGNELYAASNNLIGGTDPGAGNIIAFNATIGPGIGINDRATTTGNAVLGNSIFSNGSLGIDIGPEGLTVNDVGDGDVGGNNRQNFPLLSNVNWVGSNLRIGGTLNSTANTLFRIEFFVSPACSATGNGEGQNYLGFTTVTTDGSGNVTFTADVPAAGSSPSQVVTATATDPNNNTSEFSGCSIVPAVPPPAQSGPTFTVNTAADVDDGVCGIAECSLREAINAANSNSDTNTIAFNIGGGGLQTIQPTSELPVITSAVIIDGTSQPGFAGVPLIELDGTNAGDTSRGLTIAGGNSTVRGLVINRFALSGIWLAVGGGNVVTGNYLGTDSTGTQARGNRDGITITESANNQIGGLTAAHRNLISGNTDDGINLYDSPTTGTVIQGNYIGTDVTGQVALGNGESGIEVNDISDATIGGTTSAARNIISGNGYGIFFNQGSAEVLIQGNYIGTNATGTASLPNDAGIWLFDGNNNQIGGATAAERNVISGNNQYGVFVASYATENIIQGNFIGIDATGTVALAPQSAGVTLSGSSNVLGGTTPGARNIISGNVVGLGILGNNNTIQGNYIGTDVTGTQAVGNTAWGIEMVGTPANNMIGGTLSGAGNVIAYNGSNGIALYGAITATGNAILGNAIFSNGVLSIDISLNTVGDGVTPNDLDDTDTGPNNLQNFPILTNVSVTASGTTILGVLDTESNKAYRLEFFVSPLCDSQYYREGRTYLGFTNVTTNGNGDVTFSTNLSAVTSNGQFITATATDPNNNTSEFSVCVPVVVISPPAAAPSRNYFTTSSVPLSWQGVSWALGYEIEVDNNNDFSSPEHVNRALAASAQSHTAMLPPEDRVYYWRVGAKKPDGSIVWSAVQSFTVDMP